MIDLRLGDCLEVLKTIPDNSIDSIITDPPYGLGFMNKEWDSPEKLRQLTQREADRSADRKAEGKSPTDAPFSKSVPPGLAIKGAKEGKWFQEWCELWAVECLRILKPGGHILSFSAPRTYHRMATAFEDAGFEIRDQLMWVFGSGFPKSHNIGKAIDKIEGNERLDLGTHPTINGTGKKWRKNGSEIEYVETSPHLTKGNSDWEGWGTALKPAHEPIVMARKPLTEKSIAENVLKYGTGGINIDGSRIEAQDQDVLDAAVKRMNGNDAVGWKNTSKSIQPNSSEGRFPANIIFDEEAGQLLDEQSGISKSGFNPKANKKQYKGGVFGGGETNETTGYVDKGGASRFFYCPKTSKKDRNEGLDDEPTRTKNRVNPGGLENDPRWAPIQVKNNHPTVKPVLLMRYLINLITPPNGTTLDPFMGSGSTGKAAVRCGVNFIGIEKEQEYMDIASARIQHEQNKPLQTKLF